MLPLAYKPPALVNPLVINLAAGGKWQGVTCPPDRDVILVYPPGGRSGSLDITGQGRSFMVLSDGGTGRVQLLGTFQDVIWDARLKLAGLDALHVEATITGGLWLGNTRIETTGGTHASLHVDGLQIGDSAHVAALWIDTVTFKCDYQGVIAGLRPDGTGVREIGMRRVNFRVGDAPDVGYKPLYLGDSDQSNAKGRVVPITIHLDEVWVEPVAGKTLDTAIFPSSAQTRGKQPIGAVSADGWRTATWAPLMGVDGHVFVGVPPGGDFVPAAAAA